MRAKINHGRAGRQTPPKDYGTDSWEELMTESVMNGHKDQAIEYFNRMKEFDQKNFLLYGYADYEYGDETRNFIIRNL